MLKRIIAICLSAVMASGAVLSAAAAEVGAASAASNAYTYASEALDAEYEYSGKLGALYSPDATVFKVWAPTATEVKLNRYATGSDSEPGARSLGTVGMEKLYDNGRFTGVWQTSVSGDIVNTYYTYTITASDVRGSGTATHEIQDVYSYAVGVNGDRTMVVDLDTTDPEGWENDRHVLPNTPTESFVWEAHIKDFSYAQNSGVSEKNRGKYLAFTETGTTLNGNTNVSTCLDYLKELGITTVQLNPFCDFSSVDETGSDEQFNWGYDPKNYNVPEGSYSSDPYDGNVRIRECKAMIQALHNAGISVVMDVVYNHTASTDSCFGYTVPKYYYRMNADGSYSNGSGCGNETASERAMFRKFMIESCRYWVDEYHIDGFRFDLMAIHDVEAMNLLRANLDSVDPRITLWGEGWTGGGCETPEKTCTGAAFQGAYLWDHGNLDKRIGFFNDGIRNALKSENGGEGDRGWLMGSIGYEGKNVYYLTEGMCGKKDESLTQPTQTVTYDACHDNATLWDQLCRSQGMTDYYFERNDKLAAQNRLAGGVLNLSKGATFILAGEEMCRSKGGNTNSYNAPPDVNKIDWSLAAKNSDVVAYYRGMRQIRENFDLFTEGGSTGGYNFLTKDQTLACICTNINSAQWQQLFFVANSTDESYTYKVPYGYRQDWVVIADGLNAGVKELARTDSGTLSIPANSVVVAVDAESFDRVKINDTIGRVNVTYKNKSTGQTLRTFTFNGIVGDKYTAYTPEAYGLEYTLDSKPEGGEGVFTLQDQNVTAEYVYVESGSVTANYYLNGTSDKIKASDVYRARLGDTISFKSAPLIMGYKIDHIDPSENSAVASFNNRDINYYYNSTGYDVTLHFRHGGSARWSPVLWLWGRQGGDNTKNYCANQTWPGDTLSDPDGDGWYDKRFTVSSTDDYYNLIISYAADPGGFQTRDYTGLTQNELWIVIDDSQTWNGCDSLSIYTDNPLTDPQAERAQLYGDIGYDNDEADPKLYNISKDPYVTAKVSGYDADKTLAGAEVLIDIDTSKFPSDSFFKGYSLGEGVDISVYEITKGRFVMPSHDVTITVDTEKRKDLTIALDQSDTAEVSQEAADRLKALSCYNSSLGSFDLNGDGEADASLSGTTVTRLGGADKLDRDYTLTLGSGSITDEFGSVTFVVIGEPYTVTFSAGEGSGEMNPVTVMPNRELTLPSCTFDAPTDKFFDSWSIGDKVYKAGDKVTISADTTVTALWKDAVKITFTSENYSSSETILPGEYKLPECMFTAPDGCIFGGWSIGGLKYDAGDTINAEKPIEVAAVWNKVDFYEEIPASCEENGVAAHYRDSEGNYYTDRNGTPLADVNGDGVVNEGDLEIKAAGHRYGAPIWHWNGVGVATAEFICENDPSHVMNESASITSERKTLPDGSEALVYTAFVFVGDDVFTDEKTVTADDSDPDTEDSDLSTDVTDSDASDVDSDDGESDTDTGTVTDSDTGSDSSDTDTQTDTDAQTDTDSASDPDSDSDSDTDSDDPDPIKPVSGKFGDVDGDNEITAADALMILRSSIGAETFDDRLEYIADVDDDSTVTASDALAVLRFSVGLPAAVKVGKAITR